MTEKKAEQEGKIFSAENFYPIGIVVKDIDKTIEYYSQSFGFGPFEVRYVRLPDRYISWQSCRLPGKAGFLFSRTYSDRAH